MATAVAVPVSAINNQLGGVLPPSALVQHSPRHGRSRGMSFKGKQGGRRYSVVEDRDVSIAKAVMFVLKRTITEDQVDEEEKVDNLVEDSEGWVNLDQLLQHPKITALEVDLDDVRRILGNATKARFEFQQVPNTKAEDASSWQIRRITKRDSISEPVPVPVGDALTVETESLPEFIVYETSYQRYPLLLASGMIAQPRGGATHLPFYPVTVNDDGTERFQSNAGSETAEVSIWIDLKKTLQSNNKIKWYRAENGTVVTSCVVPQSLWKKAVARRPDIGLLLEDGEVRKEIPSGLRGRGNKGKAKTGNANQAALKQGSEDESASGNDDE
ncbi:RNA 2'-phosphotransferase, Tpt1 / KptA family domain containing protein [Rhypophila sp. PSN 637]